MTLLLMKQLTSNTEVHMLEMIAVVLVILWLLGIITSYSLGGFIHILLVIAVVVIVIRFLQGRRL
ncbi:lmo0937 family membrane protein [uncultured Desulfovibrio sp.]|uniref:lmo0937 family membrane protein n=1 Tax=uncultured Desulfovibrio sp. TaxID=167968 RepID=UPI0034429716